jgi:hypothetical protein
VDDRFDDIGSKECIAMDPADVTLVETRLLCDGTRIRSLATDELLIPAASSGDRFQERL